MVFEIGRRRIELIFGCKVVGGVDGSGLVKYLDWCGFDKVGDAAGYSLVSVSNFYDVLKRWLKGDNGV